MAANTQDIFEQTLVLRCQLGDERAFEELLKLFGPRLLLFTRRMMQSTPAQIDDVTQDAWLAIYRGLPSLLDVTKFRSWAFRIARDRIFREFRRRKVTVELLEENPSEAALEQIDNSNIDPEEIQRSLERISPGHREVLVLRFLEDLSYEDISRVTGSSIGTVRSRIHYAKRALRRAWKENSYEPK
ncbi:MAG TPA: sigma-70 family RNA polymerase sigma factor [Candidatus Acidoferrum sp.]|nr:sigma-70 family RNA polymerase sigma factor [Candidatus Acidoferrum sp.]